MTATAAPDLEQRQQTSSNLLRALSKSEHFNDANPTPEAGTAAQELWAAFESLAANIEDNPDVVDKIAGLCFTFASNATDASGPSVAVTKTTTPSDSPAPSVSKNTLQNIVDLTKLVAPKAKRWAARRQEELKAETKETKASRKAQEGYERKAIWWINGLSDRTKPGAVVGLTADHIEMVAMSLGVLLQATSVTVRRTLKIEGKSATGKVIGFSSGVVLGAALCVGALFCPFTLIAAPFVAVGGASAGAAATASVVTLASASVAGAATSIGSVVGVTKSGCQLDRTKKLEVNMSKVDITVRALVGYLCFLYNIEINAEAQNTAFFIKHLQDLGISQPVNVWSDKSFQSEFFKEAAHDLERDTIELNKSLKKLGVSIDPLICN